MIQAYANGGFPMPQSAEHFITAVDYLARERQAELKSEYLNPAG